MFEGKSYKLHYPTKFVRAQGGGGGDKPLSLPHLTYRMK